MVEIKWIKISLFLMALLQYTAAAEKHPLSLSVAVGDEVTLPCENVCDQQNCDNTIWLFSDSEIMLVYYGQINIHIYTRAKSDRLSLTANCSLVIKKVTVEDAGRYICGQFNKSGYQQGRDSLVDLSVISMTEHKDTDLVTLGCSVSTYGPCRHTLRWLFNGQDWDRHNRNAKTDQPSCYATLNFLTFCYAYISNYNLFTCQVNDSNNVQLFPFRPQTSGDDTTTVMDEPGWGMVILSIQFVGVAALIIIVVAVNIWTKTKGKKTQTDENTVNNDKDDGTVNYENPRSSDV